MTADRPVAGSRSPDHLPSAPWLRAPETLAVIAALEAEGGAGVARYVGGCVRDTLLGLTAALDPAAAPALDIDVATSLPPERVVAALERAGLKAVPTGIAHGTVTAVSRGRPYEITTLRRDVETDGRHAVVAFTDDWAQDAARRDFRLNALYAEPDGRLHDPTGGGIADALAGRVVFVGDAETRIAEGLPAHPALLPLPGLVRAGRAGRGGARRLCGPGRRPGRPVGGAGGQGAAQAPRRARSAASASRHVGVRRAVPPAAPGRGGPAGAAAGAGGRPGAAARRDLAPGGAVP